MEAGRPRPVPERVSDFAKATTDREGAPLPAKKALPGWTWGALTAVVVGIVVAVGVGRRPVVVQEIKEPASAAPLTRAAAVSIGNGKSIAVLPFENMSEAKDASAFFADGVHEDILTNLAYIRDLRVVSRTSVAQYRDTKKPISQIAEELKVAYVLEGSVRRAGNKIRVTGQLIRAATDEHVWAKAYDRDVADVFAVQAELAQAIAAALQSVIAPEAKALLERRPTEIPAAYDAYLKARQLNGQGGLTDEESIIGLLQEAVQLDPNFAAAWAMLASRHSFAYFNRDKSAGRLAQAKTAIDTAAHLAPDDPAVIEGQGDYYYYAFRDYAGASEQYRRLAAIRPNDPAVFASLSFIARRQGRLAEAVANMRRALELAPESGAFAGELTYTLACCRKYADAIAVGRGYLQKHPDSLYVAAGVAQAELALTGKTDAISAFARHPLGPEDQSRFLYLQLSNARLAAEWTEAIRLDREHRYFDGDTDNPRCFLDVWAAATLAEAGGPAGSAGPGGRGHACYERRIGPAAAESAGMGQLGSLSCPLGGEGGGPALCGEGARGAAGVARCAAGSPHFRSMRLGSRVERGERGGAGRVRATPAHSLWHQFNLGPRLVLRLLEAFARRPAFHRRCSVTQPTTARCSEQQPTLDARRLIFNFYHPMAAATWQLRRSDS